MQYRQLKLSDRHVIERMLATGYSQAQIAEAVGVSASTICRELHRNRVQYRQGLRAYCAQEAQRRAKHRKVWSTAPRTFTDQLKGQIAGKLREQWTPELICGWMRSMGKACVSHEWIYQWIYRMQRSCRGIDQPFQDLYKCLPRAHRRRRKRSGSYTPRCIIPNRVPLSKRPVSAQKRSRVGHLEADLVIGKGKNNGLLVLTDRKLRWTVIRRWSDRKANTIASMILEIIRLNPWMKTITFDNDLSFAAHERLRIKTYFTRPYHSQDKGTVEQRNQLIRTRYPKSTDFSLLSEPDIQNLQVWINNRPVKLLNFQPPQKVLDNYLRRNQKLALAS